MVLFGHLTSFHLPAKWLNWKIWLNKKCCCRHYNLENSQHTIVERRFIFKLNREDGYCFFTLCCLLDALPWFYWSSAPLSKQTWTVYQISGRFWILGVLGTYIVHFFFFKVRTANNTGKFPLWSGSYFSSEHVPNVSPLQQLHSIYFFRWLFHGEAKKSKRFWRILF